MGARGEGALGAAWKCCYLGKRSAGSALCQAPFVGAVRKGEWRKAERTRRGELGVAWHGVFRPTCGIFRN